MTGFLGACARVSIDPGPQDELRAQSGMRLTSDASIHYQETPKGLEYASHSKLLQKNTR